MDRILAVVVMFVLMGALGGLAAWWVAGQRKLHRKRDFKAMMRRRKQLWQSTALVLAGILLAAAFLGSAYVFARGGVLD